MELISVIVPIYNVEKYLEACVGSILGQTYRNIEVLLVNDGSPDGCAAICQSYAGRDPRIRYFEKANGGLSDARNYGIERAKGEYLAFIDSDDLLCPGYIGKMYEAIRENGTDICICNYYVVSDDEWDRGGMASLPEPGSSPLPILAGKLDGKEILATVASGTPNKQKLSLVWNKLYYKKIFDNLRFRFGKIHEDEFAFHEIFSGSWKVSTVNDILYIHLMRTESIMTAVYSPRRLDVTEAMQERLSLYEKLGYRTFLPRTYTQYISALCEARVRLDRGNLQHMARWREAKRSYNSLWRRVFLCMPDIRIIALYYLALFFPGLVWRGRAKWKSRKQPR